MVLQRRDQDVRTPHHTDNLNPYLKDSFKLQNPCACVRACVCVCIRVACCVPHDHSSMFCLDF
jgi:hypothetical protein